MAEPAPAPPPAPPAPPRRHPWWTTALGMLLPPLAGAAALALALAWLTRTSSGLETVLRLVDLALPGVHVQARGAQGSLHEGFSLGRLSIEAREWRVQVEQLRVAPRELAPWAGRVALESVSAARVSVDWVSTPGSAQPPESLALPFELGFERLAVGELALGARGSDPLVLADLQTRGRWGAQAIELASGQVRWKTVRTTAAGRMSTQRPYALNLAGELASTVAGHAGTAQWTANETLERLRLQARLAAGQAQGTLDAQLLPFATVPLGGVDLALTGVELAEWFDAPQARLDGRAQLKAAESPDGLVLSGPIELANTTPGPLDRDRIPARSAQGTLRWSTQGLNIEVAELRGAGGTAQGSLAWSQASQLGVEARLRGVDARELWSTLRPTSLGGRLAYTWTSGRNRFEGELANAQGLPLSARFDLSLEGERLAIAPSELRLGDGWARVQGEVQTGGERRARLRGEVRALDLAQLAPGLATRLNGELDVDGRWGAQPGGRAALTLRESTLLGHPLEGQARLAVQGESLEVEAALRSGEAQLSARGALGAGRSLELDLAVPKLAALDAALGGSVQAHAVLSGPLRQPGFDLRATARDLVLPGELRASEASLEARGAWRPDAEFRAELKVAELAHTLPQLSFPQLRLLAEGQLAEHRLQLSGQTSESQAIAAQLRGAWREPEWRGELLSAEAGKPIDFKLEAPGPVAWRRGAPAVASRGAGAPSLVVGPFDFSLARARVMAARWEQSGATQRTSGRFERLRLQTFDPSAREARRAARTERRVPLRLRGEWDLATTPQLNGRVLIERESGDLYSGVAALTPVGLTELKLEATVREDQLRADFMARGQSLGEASAKLAAWIDPRRWRLAQERPIELTSDLDLRSLAWLGPVISDNLQVDGRLRAQVRVRGTPAEPDASGQARAEDLRLAWVDQGLRFENGSAELALEEGVLVLQKLVFTGAPRVAPAQARAAAGLPDTPGSISGFGRLALHSGTGAFSLRADRMPVLQMLSRWIVASGSAELALYGYRRAELKAQLSADGAFVDFDGVRREASLPDDVVVVRSQADRVAAARPPVSVLLDVQAGLGPRFFVRGSGVESRLEGQLRVRGGGGNPLRATGTVETVDGVFAGYGQRLRIERGIVTFQGPLDNPALNVLAIRPALPVVVGVAITGTAARPVIRLYSDPAMSEQERLNWLVLGRPADASGQDRAMLATAASALLGRQTDAATATLMRNLGVDDITVRGAQGASSLLPREAVAGSLRGGSTVGTEVVALSRRVNDSINLSFEQALSGAEYALALSYQLSRSLSLVARAGTTNAITLVYTIAFD
jgi:translocation and assembly module TamB